MFVTIKMEISEFTVKLPNIQFPFNVSFSYLTDEFTIIYCKGTGSLTPFSGLSFVKMKKNSEILNTCIS